jgi:two-component system OmpR family response regulator
MKSDTSPVELAAAAREASTTRMQGTQSVRVLMVEDDDQVAGFVRQGLMQKGFMVDVAGDGLEGLELALLNTYGVMIMDVLLPGMNGLEVLQRLRDLGISTPILILSGMSDVGDRVAGLQMGGDDYLVKPFAFSELLARIESLLRRVRAAQEPLQLNVSDLLIDLLSRRVYRGDEEIILQPQEFSLLEYLVRNRGQVVTRSQILQHVWGYNFSPKTNLVEVHICRLREKLERPERPRLLMTIRGTGYMLTEDVQSP